MLGQHLIKTRNINGKQYAWAAAEDEANNIIVLWSGHKPHLFSSRIYQGKGSIELQDYAGFKAAFYEQPKTHKMHPKDLDDMVALCRGFTGAWSFVREMEL